ncbi:MAG: peptidylprolyl isomerase [Verrucomicrobiota bacterium]
MKNCILLLALACLAAPGAAVSAPTNAPAAPRPALTEDTLFTNMVVARGTGVSVTRNEVDDELVRVRAALAAQRRPLPEDSALIERQILENLINRQLLAAKMTPADKARGKQRYDQAIEKFRAASKLSAEEFDQKLAQELRVMGITRQQWEQQSLEQATIPIVLERELKINITDEMVKKFYDDNPSKFEQPEMVRVAHILLVTSDPATRADLTDAQKAAKMKQLQDLLKRARAGEDFAALAKQYSEDPEARQTGGELKPFGRGMLSSLPQFESAAFSLSTNQVSDIITTPYGYHILKLYEKIPAHKMPLDADTMANIRDYLRDQEIRKLSPAYLQKLRAEAGVKILDERLAAVEVPTGSETPPAAPSAIPSAK